METDTEMKDNKLRCVGKRKWKKWSKVRILDNQDYHWIPPINLAVHLHQLRLKLEVIV